MINLPTGCILADIQTLVPYAKNPKNHDNKDIELIIRSVKRNGWGDPLLVCPETMEVLSGNGRLMAAKELGMEQVPVVYAPKGLTEKQKADLVIASNKLVEVSGYNDNLMDLVEDFGLDLEDYGMEDLEIPAKDEKDVVEDEVPETVQTRCKRGDIWQLGNHRLMCGDSTSVDDVEKLMNGNKADMVFTDPPYGVDYKGINNDDRSGLEDLLSGAFFNMFVSCKSGSSVYCFHSDKCADIFHKVFRKYCHFSSMIIWKKQSLVLSQTDYQSIHEPCLYGWLNNGNHQFHGDRKQTSVWEYERENIKGHTTPKPINLICKALKNSSKEKECVLDLFGGSGSTLIACEQLDRKCFMMELDEHYCDVIIQRWENLTGKTAKRIEDENN